MDLPFCINVNSFPAPNKEAAVELFNDALQGVLELASGEERIQFYLETSRNIELSDLELASDFCYADFLDECSDIDLQAFLYEIEDKSPALDTLSEEQQEELMSLAYYVADRAAGDDDLYSLAWVLDAYLLSLATEDYWKNNEIRINKLGDSGQYDDYLLLKNIASQTHGAWHYQQANIIDLEALLAPHKFTKNLISWFEEQTKENKNIIINKLKLAKEKEFQGGEPLFKTLGDGVREIRFSAYAGGAIRVFFKHLENTQQALLLGFVKHSDKEGYAEKIPEAKKLYQEITSLKN